MKQVKLNKALPANKHEMELKILSLACNRVDISIRRAKEQIEEYSQMPDTGAKMLLIKSEQRIFRKAIQEVLDTILTEL